MNTVTPLRPMVSEMLDGAVVSITPTRPDSRFAALVRSMALLT